MIDSKVPIIALTFDFETGGLNCQKSACTQIAMHATRLDTFEKIGSYMSYILPYNKKNIKGVGKKRKTLKSKFDDQEEDMMEYTDRALEYSAITMDMLYDKGKPIEQVAQELIDFIVECTPKKTSKANKPFLIGQNVGFDEGFLCQMMEYAGLMKELKKVLRGHEDFYGNWHPLTIDTILLGQLSMCHIPNVDSYKLEIMCENLGIELFDAHDADADVSATTNVVAVLTQRMRNLSGTEEGDGGIKLNMSQTEKTRKHFKI